MDSNTNRQVLLKDASGYRIKTIEHESELQITADGEPAVWLLYTPEEDQYKDPNMYLWVRRCEVFRNEACILFYLEALGITIDYAKFMAKHESFPELYTITDIRGKKWYACKAPIHIE